MRRFCLPAVLVCLFFIPGSSQTSPTDPGAAPTTGTATSAADPARPQNQTPPDSKAPAPTDGKTDQSSSSQTAATSGSTGPHYLLARTDIRASLDAPLSTKTAKPGDRFTATVTTPVHDSAGNIVIPEGSKVNGQISQPGDEKLEGAIKDMGHLSLRFTDIQIPNGTDVPISVTLISIHNSHPAPSSVTSHLTGSSAIAANGGFTGGGLGRPLKGIAVGNLPGGGYVLATTAKQVELPAQCVFRLRVDRNTPLP